MKETILVFINVHNMLEKMKKIREKISIASCFDKKNT